MNVLQLDYVLSNVPTSKLLITVLVPKDTRWITSIIARLPTILKLSWLFLTVEAF